MISFIQVNSLEFKKIDEADKDHENNTCEMDTDATAPIVHDTIKQKRLRLHEPETTLEVGAKHVVPGLYCTFLFLAARTHHLTFHIISDLSICIHAKVNARRSLRSKKTVNTSDVGMCVFFVSSQSHSF